MTYVTCPTMRYHPAVVAQKAATVQSCSRRAGSPSGSARARTSTSTSSAAGWPPVNVRHEMLVEAVEIITRALRRRLRQPRRRALPGRLGEAVGPARPARADRVAVSGDQSSVELFAPLADHLVAVEPEADAGDRGRDAGRTGEPRKSASCRSAGTPTATRRWPRARAVPLVRRRLEGQRRAARARRLRRRHPVRPAGGRRRQHPLRARRRRDRRGVREFGEAGFTDVALVQIGDDRQQDFLAWRRRSCSRRCVATER